MKYLSLVLAVCLSVTLVMPVSATTPDVDPEFTLYVKAVKERTVEVALLNLQKEKTSISIQSLDGTKTFYSNIVKDHNGFRKRLNFRNLDYGKYLLVVEQNGEKLTQVIVLDDKHGMLLSDISK